MKCCVRWKAIHDLKNVRFQQVSNPGPLDQQASTYGASVAIYDK